MELCALRSETAAVRANLREASMISALRLAKKKSDQDNEANSGMTRSCGGNKVRAESSPAQLSKVVLNIAHSLAPTI